MNTRLTFDDYFQDTWDYVSEKVITDNFWEKYQEVLREMTFEYYMIYKKADGILHPQMAAKMLENQFSTFFKYNMMEFI